MYTSLALISHTIFRRRSALRKRRFKTKHFLRIRAGQKKINRGEQEAGKKRAQKKNISAIISFHVAFSQFLTLFFARVAFVISRQYVLTKSVVNEKIENSRIKAPRIRPDFRHRCLWFNRNHLKQRFDIAVTPEHVTLRVSDAPSPNHFFQRKRKKIHGGYTCKGIVSLNIWAKERKGSENNQDTRWAEMRDFSWMQKRVRGTHVTWSLPWERNRCEGRKYFFRFLFFLSFLKPLRDLFSSGISRVNWKCCGHFLFSIHISQV